MYEHILIPVALDHERDVSGEVAVARRLRTDDGKITLLGVVEEPPAFVAEFVAVKPRSEIERAVQERLEAASGGQPDLRCTVVFGTPGVAIPEYAVANRVDLIVLGSRRPGLHDYFLGTTASRVVRRAPCAVFVVR